MISLLSFSESQGAIKSFDMTKSSDNKKIKPPDYYTNIQPVATDEYKVFALENEWIHRDGMKSEIWKVLKREWPVKAVKIVGSEEVIDKHTNVSLKTFHASQTPQIINEIVQFQILPVFTEAANLFAMAKQFLVVIFRVHSFRNPDETLFVTVDQPLFPSSRSSSGVFQKNTGLEETYC